jgi:hypothetical protein
MKSVSVVTNDHLIGEDSKKNCELSEVLFNDS